MTLWWISSRLGRDRISPQHARPALGKAHTWGIAADMVFSESAISAAETEEALVKQRLPRAALRAPHICAMCAHGMWLIRSVPTRHCCLVYKAQLQHSLSVAFLRALISSSILERRRDSALVSSNMAWHRVALTGASWRPVCRVIKTLRITSRG